MNFELQKCEIKLWAKFVNHLMFFDNLCSRKNYSVTAASDLKILQGSRVLRT